MAYKDSDELKTDERYPLGDYSFRIERSSVPGSSNDQITAICTQGGKNARKSIQIPSSIQLFGWYVEANGTTADVYAYIDNSSSPSGLNLQKIYGSISGTLIHPSAVTSYSNMPGIQTPVYKNGHYYFLCAGETQITQIVTKIWNNDSQITYTETVSLSAHYEKEGKTVCYSTAIEVNPDYVNWGVSFTRLPDNVGLADAAWELIYSPSITNDQILIGRFAIDLEDAGGVGPGSDWTDPGDYDPDWEEGDPTHTLYVTVTGALSGRHNDPIVDPSYSYIPAEKDTVKDYGCGGDGGHGGGGGAGASTVVVHKFATNQANSKEVTAIARRHGYGSGGGKGGKGGDGCILVYY